MNLSPEEKKRIYEEEKIRAEAQDKAKRELKDKQTKQGCIGCLIVAAVILLIGLASGWFTSGHKTEKQAVVPSERKVADPAVRARFDKKVADNWVSSGGGLIVDCTVDSSELDKGGSTVYVKVYLKATPSDLRESLEHICESTHDIYNSAVSITAYRATPTGKDWRKVGTSDWSLASNEVKTRLF